MVAVVLGILLGLAVGGLIATCYILRLTNQDLTGVRRRYLELHIELGAERRANRERETTLYDRLSSNASEIVSEVTTGVAMCLNGLPNAEDASDRGKQERDTNRDIAGDWEFDDDVPRDRQGNKIKANQDEVQWIPEIELDPEMVSALGEQSTVVSPAMGGWVANTPVQPREGEVGHQIRNGQVSRADGQPMFRPGTSGKPPTPGIED